MPSLSCRARGHDEGFRRRASLWNRPQQQDCVRRRRSASERSERDELDVSELIERVVEAV